jgi:hypothetical protein
LRPCGLVLVSSLRFLPDFEAVEDRTLLSTFVVNNTADSGAGSLRQAMLDSNATATGPTNVIDFAIPGSGVQTIAPLTPLPAITAGVLIDGASQPRYAGTPLIAIDPSASGSPDGLVVAGTEATVEGVTTGGLGLASTNVWFAPTGSSMVTVGPSPIAAGSSGLVITQRIDAPSGGTLAAGLELGGLTAGLALVSPQGNVLVQSDGPSPNNPKAWIDEYLPAGTYTLVVEPASGSGTVNMSISMTPATDPLGSFPVSGFIGAVPGSVAAADFTGHGEIDLAAVGPIDTVLVFEGNGDGTFRAPLQYFVEPFADSIVAGDFAGNGRIDLAVLSSFTGALSVLLNNGDGTFEPASHYSVARGSTAIAAGDCTGDGRDDLAVANPNDDTVSVLLSRADGTFQPPIQYSVGGGPDAIAVGDFTGEGRTDLAVANGPSDTVSVLLGNGDGTFGPQIAYSVGNDPDSVVAGDFTGDGRDDLAVANVGDQTVSVLLSNADGTFQPQVPYAVESAPDAIAAGEFTSDGRDDLAVANSGDNSVSILVGNGDGTFQPQVAYSAGFHPVSIAVGDFTGNGRADLAVDNLGAGTFASSISILFGNGAGAFQPSASNLVEASPDAMVAGEFTDNGRTDVAVLNYASDTVSVLLGNGDGTFQPQETYSVGPNPMAIIAGDFNGDGRTDLAVVNQGTDAPYSDGTVSVLLGNGDGTFQEPVSYPVGPDPASITAGDFTGDGRIDLAVVNRGLFFSEGSVSVLLGNGDGTFQSEVRYDVGNGADSIAAGDFAGDGRTDLAVANSWDNTVSVLLGNGDGSFQPQVTYPAGYDPDSVVAGNFAGGDRDDLAVANGYGNTVSVLVSGADGSFAPMVQYPIGGAASTAAAPDPIVTGDFTGDGRLDLAVANSAGNSVSILLGNGDGTFSPGVSLDGGSGLSCIATGTFTYGGLTDLAVANANGAGTVSVLLSDGDGTFSDPGKVAVSAHSSPVVADVNGDGVPDVMVLNSAGEILYRQGVPGQPGTFEPPVAINPGAPSLDIAWVPNTNEGPVLASVDAGDSEVTLFAWRDGRFVSLGSLATGRLPAQIIAADLTSDGWTDLVVRNAADASLSVFLNTGPAGAGSSAPFYPAEVLPVGQGVSDVQAVDTTGDGTLVLVVTNQVTGQIGILPDLGNGTFGPLEPYRAGTGLSSIETGSGSAEVKSLDGSSGVAGGALTAGALTSLVTANAGSNTIGVLSGLGGGLFADPIAIRTQNPAQVVRMADLTGNGIDDLVLLGSTGLTVMLADGKGGIEPPMAYDVGADPTGLTIADITGNGIPDLLVSNAFGDLLVLLGRGDGTFQPYRNTNQTIELAVADLTGNGSEDIIYADQALSQVVVDYGAGGSTVLGDQSTGVLDPGAVKLADLTGNGIPDLIVANSGGNDVLIYPGLGGLYKGQFGPEINGGQGYGTGTDPVGVTVADLTGDGMPDLVIANKGSNDLTILLNQSHGGDISFRQGESLLKAGYGPVATVVQDVLGNGLPDILVSNSGSNNVMLLPGIGGGFFNDTSPQTFTVGNDPGPLFVEPFDGKLDLVTVNAGSNDITLISNFLGADAVTEMISSGGTDPLAAFAFVEPGSGFEDLVVANAGDGVLALFDGSASGLSLFSSETNPDLPSPTALVQAGPSAAGQVQFYAVTEGREAAILVALSVGNEIGPAGASSGAGKGNGATSSEIASGGMSLALTVAPSLVALQENSLQLVGTLLIVTLESSANGANFGFAEIEATTSLSISSAVGLGQSGLAPSRFGVYLGDSDEQDGAPRGGEPQPEGPTAPEWQRFLLGTDEAIEKFSREHPDLSAPARDQKPATGPTGGHGELQAPAQPLQEKPDAQSTSSQYSVPTDAIDQAIERLDKSESEARGKRSVRRVGETHRVFDDMRIGSVGFTHPTIVVDTGRVQEALQKLDEMSVRLIDWTRTSTRPESGQGNGYDVSAALALAATVARGIYVPAPDRKRRLRAFVARSSMADWR